MSSKNQKNLLEPLKRLFFYAQKWNEVVEQGMRVLPFVPLRDGTRKKSVPLFSLPRSTTKKREKVRKTYEKQRKQKIFILKGTVEQVEQQI